MAQIAAVQYAQHLTIKVTVIHDEYGDTHLVVGSHENDGNTFNSCPSCGVKNHQTFSIMVPNEPGIIEITKAGK